VLSGVTLLTAKTKTD